MVPNAHLVSAAHLAVINTIAVAMVADSLTAQRVRSQEANPDRIDVTADSANAVWPLRVSAEA